LRICRARKQYLSISGAKIEAGTAVKQDRISAADLFGLARRWLLPYDHRQSERPLSDATDVREAKSNRVRWIRIRARLTRLIEDQTEGIGSHLGIKHDIHASYIDAE
jgi:hypothetical protein